MQNRHYKQWNKEIITGDKIQPNKILTNHLKEQKNENLFNQR